MGLTLAPTTGRTAADPLWDVRSRFRYRAHRVQRDLVPGVAGQVPLAHCPVLVLRVVNELIKVSQVGEEGFAACVCERGPAVGAGIDRAGGE